MALLVEMLGPNFSKLVLLLSVLVVDGDCVVLGQLLDEEVSQRDVVCPKGVGAIAGNMKRLTFVHSTTRRVLGFQVRNRLLSFWLNPNPIPSHDV